MSQHLKGLDTLRAIAASVVVWGHIELIKANNGISNLIQSGFNVPSGHLGVVLFFVISGFLITYLLVKEHDNSGDISFKKFYMRRILRIWPLYYIIILSSYLLFQNEEYSCKTILLCISIFPNVAHAFVSGWPTSPQIWSIGVEEQFYLFWPILLFIIPQKRIPLFLITFFVAYSLLPHFIAFVNARIIQDITLESFNNKFFFGTKFNCMSVGALVGYLHAKQSKWLHYLSSNAVSFSFIAISLLCWTLGVEFKHFTAEFYSIIFAITLYGIVQNPSIRIDTKITAFLGRISYGIYMYHWIVILLAMKIIPNTQDMITYNIILYGIVITGTILISWLSFISVERYFLNIKKRFETK